MMEYTEIMVRYGELSTKGRNERSFIDRLGNNIRQALRKFDKLDIEVRRDRTHIRLNGTNYDDVMKSLKRVFGVQNFAPAIRVDKNVDAAIEAAASLVEHQVTKPTTFKIQTRHADHDFPVGTFEMNDKLGGALLHRFPKLLKVDVHHPQLEIRCEIRKDGIYLMSEKILGAGGMPVGTAGKGVMMLSGGIDSPVAAYLAMKRGVKVEMIHFFSPPYTSDQALSKAKQLTAKLAAYSGSIEFIQVPFTEIQETVKADVPSGYLMTIQRRFMLRLAVEIARRRKALGVFNGESLGQVASQTMESMVAIEDVTSLPVLRPVLSYDKNEIIKVAKQIGTYDLSILPYEDCCTIFAPTSPKTKPKLDRVRSYEERLDVVGLMQRALDGIKVSRIHPDDHYLNENQDVFAELL